MTIGSRREIEANSRFDVYDPFLILVYFFLLLLLQETLNDGGGVGCLGIDLNLLISLRNLRLQEVSFWLILLEIH